MAFRLEPGEILADGLDRVAREEIQRARNALLAETDPEAGVLEARKSLKKVRAVLRLARAPLGKKEFRARNHRYRDLARRLAEQRTGTVRFETLVRLSTWMDGDAPGTLVRASRRRLATRRRRHDDAAVRAEVAVALSTGCPPIGPLPIEGIEDLRYGLGRTYRRGRAAMRRAVAAPTSGTLHEWRKRVKDLWYHVRLFGCVWPGALEPLAEELHRLSNHLGSVHDLDLLEAALREEERIDPRFDPKPLLTALNTSRAVECAGALDLGARIYVEEPESFVDRIESYWRAWSGSAATQ